MLRRLLGTKALRMVLSDTGSGATTRNDVTPEADRVRFCLDDTEVLELADTAVAMVAKLTGAVVTPQDAQSALTGA